MISHFEGHRCQDSRRDSPKKLLLVLCGLPASGKSTLAADLEHLCREQGTATRIVCFDKISDELHSASSEECSRVFDPALWKAARSAGFAEVAEALSGLGGPSGRLLFIVDDNLQYRSMRHACYRLARVSGAAYGQVYMCTSLETSLARNKLRHETAQVPEHVIRRMAGQLEAPDGERHPWESRTITLHQQGIHPLEDLWESGKHVFEAMEEMWRVAAPPIVPPPPRLPPAPPSAAHSLDLESRRVVSAAMAALPQDTPPDVKQKLATALASARTEFLRASQESRGSPDCDAMLNVFGDTCRRILSSTITSS